MDPVGQAAGYVHMLFLLFHSPVPSLTLMGTSEGAKGLAHCNQGKAEIVSLYFSVFNCVCRQTVVSGWLLMGYDGDNLQTLLIT